MTMTKRNESYGYSAFAKHSAEIFSPAAQLVFSSVLSSDDTPPSAQSPLPPALRIVQPPLRHSHIHMTPMAHQKVAGPIRPFKWPSGLEEIGGRRQEVCIGGQKLLMRHLVLLSLPRPASSFSYGRRSQRRPWLLVALSSFLARVHSGPVESDAKTRKHNMIRTHTHTYVSPSPAPYIVCTIVSICKTLRLCAWMSLPHSAGCVQFYAVYLDSAVKEGLNLGGFSMPYTYDTILQPCIGSDTARMSSRFRGVPFSSLLLSHCNQMGKRTCSTEHQLVQCSAGLRYLSVLICTSTTD